MDGYFQIDQPEAFAQAAARLTRATVEMDDNQTIIK